MTHQPDTEALKAARDALARLYDLRHTLMAVEAVQNQKAISITCREDAEEQPRSVTYMIDEWYNISDCLQFLYCNADLIKSALAALTPHPSGEQRARALEDIQDNIHPDGRISLMGGVQLLSPETMETIRSLLQPQPLKAAQTVGDLHDAAMDALDRIDQWAEAYPEDIFPKPDLKKARELLAAGGITIDSVSADSMRHVIKSVATILTPVRNLLNLTPVAVPADEKGEVEAYELGKRDGYEEAVQDIDVLTGGDGEYFSSTIPGEGCPDPEAMKERIRERFEALSAPTDAQGGAVEANPKPEGG